jgi:hypothetical protein
MRPNKIYDIEVLEGDMVYVGKEVFAKSKQQAFEMMILMFGGEINEDSEIILCEEKTMH